MITVCGVWLSQMPGGEEIAGMLDKEYLEAWKQAHQGVRREERWKAGLTGLLLLQESAPKGVIAYGAQGRPSFLDRCVDFSITHTDRAVFCSVSVSDKKESRVGIDAEDGQRMARLDPISMAKRWFLEEERELLARDSDELAFLRVWTRKEALFKWQGTGHLHRANTATAEREREIRFHEYRVGTALITLCCDREEIPPKQIRMFSDEEIAGWREGRKK